jgi:hypothetical protein
MPERAMPEVVLATGAYRSASTWLYNAVRLALCADGRVVYGRFYDATYDPQHPAPTHVIKVHRYIPELCDVARRCLTSIRDPRDLVASAVRRGLIAPNPEVAAAFAEEAVLLGYERWRHHAAAIVRYEELVAGDPRDVLARILTALAPLGVEHADPDTLAAQLAALQCGARYNRETLLWPNHITDGGIGVYGKTLPYATITRIEERLGDWMASNGYPL